MSRLIDADEFKRVMYHEAFETDSDLQKWDSGCWIRYKMFENAIENFPAVDAVPVVRCRDCKHKRMVLKSGCLGCDIHCCLHPYDWYCPDGEKVTE